MDAFLLEQTVAKHEYLLRLRQYQKQFNIIAVCYTIPPSHDLRLVFSYSRIQVAKLAKFLITSHFPLCNLTIWYWEVLATTHPFRVTVFQV